MSGLFKILEKIQKRPGMYLGKTSLTSLHTFVNGYEFAREELGIESSEKEREFHQEFQPWLQQRFAIQTVNSWANIILFSSRDEKEAFSYFFELLEEFWNRHKNLENNKREQMPDQKSEKIFSKSAAS